MNLAELQKEAHAIAQDQGWWDTERTFGDCIADVHEGLSRARKAHRKWGDTEPHYDGRMVDTEDGPYPVTIRLEDVPFALAEVAIRVADMAEHEHVGLVSLNPRWTEAHLNPKASFGEWIAFGHLLLADCYLLAQHGHPLIEDVSAETWEEAMCNFIGFIRKMAAHHDIDLDAAIAAKMEYYRASPHRHVGGRAVTSQRSELITVSDGHTPCEECPGYIDTKSEAFIALVIPMEAHHQLRGVATFHPKCYLERDHTQSVYIVTGVHEGEAL